MSTDSTAQTSFLWYAAFGSNISRNRFDKYLKGGSAELASGSAEPGARNPSDPVGDTTMTVDHQLFFAWEAKKWDGGGVAFLSPEKSAASTICRLYKITVEQFEDVHMAEAGAQDLQPLDVARLILKGELVQYDRLYGLALHLGTHDDGLPIVTLTTQRRDLSENCPSLGYAATIGQGLLECTAMSSTQALDYLLATPGVDQRLDANELLEAISSND